MRRAAIVLLLLAGCASGRNDHHLRISVSQLITQRQAVITTGTHLFRIRILNQSRDAVVFVHAIHLQPVGLDLFSDDPSQYFDREVDPGETEIFEMYLTVDTHSALGTSAQPVMDSVQLTLNGTSDGKDFVDSGTYAIGREVLGR